MGSGIFEAYAAGTADAFYEGHFARPEDRQRARRAVRPIVPALAAALERQNARYAPSPARDAHLKALRAGAGAVVTGQQVGLFLGPLFTLYKAATTIRLAKALQAEWGAPVVPVFWLQTEDHDVAEIARCYVAASRGEARLLELPAPEGRESVAHRVLPEDVTTCLKQLGDALAPWPHAEAHLRRLALHYRPGAAWGAAFAGVLASLFDEEGLVLLDPRDPELAPLAAPVHRRAIVEAGPLARALEDRARALESAGVAPEVHVREGSPLSFFHPDGPEGPRFRLEATAGGFAEVGGTRVHGRSALLEALETRPACFSTSALLRPILQDTWLPTVAYVGGPSEVAYFAQLPPLYAAFEVAMPLVVPRIRLRIVEDEPRRLLERLNLDAGDCDLPVEDLLARARGNAGEDAGGEAVARRLLASFDLALGELDAMLGSAGPAVEPAIAKTRESVARAVAKLGGNYDKARLFQDKGLVADARRLQRWLHPHGLPQERVCGLSYFAARYGERAILTRVLAAAEPFAIGPEDLAL